MSDSLQFPNRVVVVTGAGGGLGRQYALAFAARGASVVVNDLGVDRHGAGSAPGGQSPADKVVQEIVAKGGKAVANYDSVENGDKIIESAIKAFGRIDVVVNNAGILRDKSFANMSDDDWDIIHRVHLRGSFLVTRAAWPHMRKQGFGRIIMTSSAAGVYGNFGQANYSAAKMGLVGLSNTLALEGAKYDIHCNTICPIAGSRLTETVMPPDLVEQLRAEYVAPLVLYLCHDSCSENGGLFEVGAGWVGKLRWECSKGVVVRKKNVEITPEKVREHWSEITGFTNARHPASIQESTGNFVAALQQIDVDEATPSHGLDSSKPGLEKMIGYKFPSTYQFSYTHRDLILYALGVGLSTKHTDHLKFLYEGAEGFTALPTFSVVPAFAAFREMFASEQFASLGIDLSQLLHGEHFMQLHKSQWPVEGTVSTTITVDDVIDKGRGVLFVFRLETRCQGGDLLATNEFVAYVRGMGGYGGKRKSDRMHEIVEVPSDRKPDLTVEEVTSIDQAALYRLSGDPNPLHIDPNFASLGGFSKPILHGLCTFGFAVRQVYAQFLSNDSTKFSQVKVRFTKPVLPGQTIVTEMWRSSTQNSRIHIQCRVKETGEICLSGGYVDAIGDVPSVAKPANHQTAEKAIQPPSSKDSSRLDEKVFNEMAARVKQNPQVVDTVKAVYQWNILPSKGSSDATQHWTVDLKNKPGAIYNSPPRNGTKADCTLELDDDTLLSLVTGKLNPQKAFMSGKLKIRGNIMLSQKLSSLLQSSSAPQAKL